MPFDLPGYDQWELATPPRFEDLPGADPDENEDDSDLDDYEAHSGGGPIA